MNNFNVERNLRNSDDMIEAIEKGEDVDLAKVAEIMGSLRKTAAKQNGQIDALRQFSEAVSRLNIWGFDDDLGNPYEECDEPEDGYADSHECLMNLIEKSRNLLDEKLTKIDTVIDLVQMISFTAMKARAGGQSVSIDNTLPSVSVVVGEDDEYFFQETEADQLIRNSENAISGLEEDSGLAVSVEDYILYLAQGW